MGGGIAQIPRKQRKTVKSQQKANVQKVRASYIKDCRRKWGCFLNKCCQGCCYTLVHHCQTHNLPLFIFPSCSSPLFLVVSLHSLSICVCIFMLWRPQRNAVYLNSLWEPIRNTSRSYSQAPPSFWSDILFHRRNSCGSAVVFPHLHTNIITPWKRFEPSKAKQKYRACLN